MRSGRIVGWVERSETHHLACTRLMGFASLYPAYGCVVRCSDRIPRENVRGAIELVERSLERRHAVLGDGLRRPAFATMDRAQRSRLAHQEDLVHPHRKNLP